MGKKTFKEAAKVSKVYTTEEIKKLLAKNEHFTIRERPVKSRPQKSS